MYGTEFYIQGGSLWLDVENSAALGIGFMPERYPGTMLDAAQAGAVHAWLAREVEGGRFETVDFSSRYWPALYEAEGETPSVEIPEFVHEIGRLDDDVSHMAERNGFLHRAIEEASVIVNMSKVRSLPEMGALEDMIDARLLARESDVTMLSFGDVIDVPVLSPDYSLGVMTA